MQVGVTLGLFPAPKSPTSIGISQTHTRVQIHRTPARWSGGGGGEAKKKRLLNSRPSLRGQGGRAVPPPCRFFLLRPCVLYGAHWRRLKHSKVSGCKGVLKVGSLPFTPRYPLSCFTHADRDVVPSKTPGSQCFRNTTKGAPGATLSVNISICMYIYILNIL